MRGARYRGISLNKNSAPPRECKRPSCIPQFAPKDRVLPHSAPMSVFLSKRQEKLC
jgi:hypothetical protein